MRYRELLNEVDINSAKFKQWFKGSRVIEPLTNAPLICYHGTTKSHEIKPAGGQHFGTFHAANQRISDKLMTNWPLSSWDVGSIYPVYLSIKKPVLLEDGGQWYDSHVIMQLVDQGLVDETTLELFQNGEDSTDWIEICKKLGYDGVVYFNQYEDAGSVSWYPFSDNQVWNIFANAPY